jgi:hypothetical protein
MVSGFRSVTTGWLKLTDEELKAVTAELGRGAEHFYHNNVEGGDGLHYSFHFFDYVSQLRCCC